MQAQAAANDHNLDVAGFQFGRTTDVAQTMTMPTGPLVVTALASDLDAFAHPQFAVRADGKSSTAADLTFWIRLRVPGHARANQLTARVA